MFKVSFKEDYKDVLIFQNKVTVVTLTGRMMMGLEHIPHHIWTWALNHPSVDVNVDYSNGHECWILKASGKAKCHKDDSPNPKLGERIAESRAKIKLYKFMQTLMYKFSVYYTKLLTGKEYMEVYAFCNSNSLSCTLRKYTELLEHERYHLDELLQKTV